MNVPDVGRNPVQNILNCLTDGAFAPPLPPMEKIAPPMFDLPHQNF